MDNNVVNQFSFNFKEVLLDEIALEGLEGVGFDLLWRRVEKRTCSPVTEKIKARFYGFLVHCASVNFYEIPVPLPYVEIKDRFEIIDEETGNILDPPELLDGPFTYAPVNNDYGSCVQYKKRKLIPKNELQQIPYDKVIGFYGDKIVVVATLEERWKALVPHLPINYLIDMAMTSTHYCLLELIGRSRENGQMTIGNTNLTKIVKDSKLLFYNRKFLQKNDLIRIQPVPQVTANRSVKALLLRLKRFHQTQLLSLPKHGKVHDIAEYLMTQPNYSDSCQNIFDTKVATQALCKRLSKCENSFIFENSEGLTKKRSKQLTNRIIRLDPASEDDSQSEDETIQERPCQYQVKVNLQRQAYERILEAGLDGLSQIEVAELLGIEYYTARSICRTFKHKNIVKEIFVDRGKQRTAKFIAAASAAAVDANYEKEKQKFLEYVDEGKNAIATRNISELPDDDKESECEIPKKKPKLKLPKGIEDILPDAKTIERTVTEVKHLDGFENVKTLPFLGPGKGPTMRQLRYANGILKTIQDKVLVTGYMNLNSMASKESNEPLMDNKCMKIIVQKLVSEGQIKLLKMSWPVWHKTCTIFCAPHVQVTDSIVKTKYKEISLSVLRNRRVEKSGNKKEKKDPNPDVITRPLAMSIYPRYLKLQKLHEFLIKMVYFNNDDSYHTTNPEGFSCLVDMIPEFTVEFVLGNMSHIALMSMYNVQIPENMLQQKLRNVPGELFKTFLATPTLQNGWRQNLKVLSTLGLLQLIKNSTASDENYVLSYEFYINRHASIIDTRGDWPRENVDLEALRKTYYFNTFADVEQYWKDVYEISVNTTIRLEPNQRSRKQPFYIPRLKEEVSANDNGQFYGNGMGPCGFDSTFFLDLPKLWVMSHTKMKHHALLKKPVIKAPKRRKPGKPKKPKATTMKRRTVNPPSEKKKRCRPPTTSIPKWTKEEDRVIMLCKAAITVLSPTAHTGCLKLRNLVAKDILSMNDPKKTATTCHKRAAFLESNTTFAYEKDCLINELRRYPNILRRYEGIFKTLRLQYCGQISKVIVTARIPMLELVYLLLQMIRSDNFNKRTECVALNLEDFYNNFTICPSTVNRNFNSYKTPTESGPVLAAIKEGIIIAVLTTYRVSQSPETAKKIHGMFSVYPEQNLRPAIEQLRKAGAVAAREKTMNNAIHKFHFQDIAQSSYKLSTNYMRHWICRMNAEFADNLMFSLDDDIPKNDLKGTPELNCLLFESQACDILDFKCVSVPTITGSGGSLLQEEQLSVSEMIMRYKIKPGAVDCRYKKKINKFPDLFQDLEYESALESLLRQAQLQQPPENLDDADRIIPENIEDKDRIISYVGSKKKDGCSFDELRDATALDKETLISHLQALESQNMVKRLGYFENLIVLTTYAKPWAIPVKDKQVIPTPWLTLDFDIRNDVFLKWAGVIVNKVFTKPGCSIGYIANECEFLTARAAQDICTVLEKCKCVVLKCVNVSEPDLFSEDVMPECEEFNPYAAVDYILVFPVKNILTRYSYLRKKMFDDEYYFEKT